MSALFLATLLTGPDQLAAQCRQCEMCPGSEHKNVACPWCFTGNLDGEHSYCWSFPCDLVHPDNHHPCEGMLALEAAQALPSVDDAAAEAIMARYPAHAVLHPSGRFVQILTCGAERVLAQFEIRGGGTVLLDSRRHTTLGGLRIGAAMSVETTRAWRGTHG